MTLLCELCLDEFTLNESEREGVSFLYWLSSHNENNIVNFLITNQNAISHFLSVNAPLGYVYIVHA